MHPPGALRELLPRADALLVCLPGTEETRGWAAGGRLAVGAASPHASTCEQAYWRRGARAAAAPRRRCQRGPRRRRSARARCAGECRASPALWLRAGAVIDEHALYAALREGRLHGAGLDVWWSYPATYEEALCTPPSAFPYGWLHHAACLIAASVAPLTLASVANRRARPRRALAAPRRRHRRRRPRARANAAHRRDAQRRRPGRRGEDAASVGLWARVLTPSPGEQAQGCTHLAHTHTSHERAHTLSLTTTALGMLEYSHIEHKSSLMSSLYDTVRLSTACPTSCPCVSALHRRPIWPCVVMSDDATRTREPRGVMGDRVCICESVCHPHHRSPHIHRCVCVVSPMISFILIHRLACFPLQPPPAPYKVDRRALRRLHTPGGCI